MKHFTDNNLFKSKRSLDEGAAAGRGFYAQITTNMAFLKVKVRV